MSEQELGHRPKFMASLPLRKRAELPYGGYSYSADGPFAMLLGREFQYLDQQQGTMIYFQI